MLDLIGAIAGMVAVAVNLTAFATVLPLTLMERLGLAAVVGAWVGLATGLGAAGALAFSLGQPVPLVGVLFATPLIVVGALFVSWPRARAALLAIPMPLLIGLNSFRILGALFLFLAAVGRLSGPFPYSAGWGDVITGALAIPLAFAAARDRRPDGAIAAWNAFGALDLFTAVALGVTSTNGGPLQLIHAGAGADAMNFLPFCLIPTVLVPFYLITHGIVALQLAARHQVAAPAR